MITAHNNAGTAAKITNKKVKFKKRKHFHRLTGAEIQRALERVRSH